MKKVYGFAVAAVVLLALPAGCGRRCGVFPEKILAYMPYYEGEVVKFKNSITNDTATLVISHVSKDEEAQPCGRLPCCEGLFLFRSTFDSIADLGISGYIDIFFRDHPTPRIRMTYSIKMGESEYDLYAGSDGVDLSSPELDRIYGDTMIINKINKCRVEKLTVVSGSGLIRFHDVQTGCYWENVN